MIIIIGMGFWLVQLIFADLITSFTLFPAFAAAFWVCNLGAIFRFAIEAHPCVALVPEAGAAGC